MDMSSKLNKKILSLLCGAFCVDTLIYFKHHKPVFLFIYLLLFKGHTSLLVNFMAVNNIPIYCAEFPK